MDFYNGLFGLKSVIAETSTRSRYKRVDTLAIAAAFAHFALGDDF